MVKLQFQFYILKHKMCALQSELAKEALWMLFVNIISHGLCSLISEILCPSWVRFELG